MYARLLLSPFLVLVAAESCAEAFTVPFVGAHGALRTRGEPKWRQGHNRAVSPGTGLSERPALRLLKTAPSSLGDLSDGGMARQSGLPSVCMTMHGDRNVGRQVQALQSFRMNRRRAMAGILSGYWALVGNPEGAQAQETRYARNQEEARKTRRGEWYFEDGTWFKKKGAELDDDTDELDVLKRKEEENEKRRAAAAVAAAEEEEAAEIRAEDERQRLARLREEKKRLDAAAAQEAAELRLRDERAREESLRLKREEEEEEEEEDKGNGLLPLWLGGLAFPAYYYISLESNVGANVSAAPAASGRELLEQLARGRSLLLVGQFAGVAAILDEVAAAAASSGADEAVREALEKLVEDKTLVVSLSSILSRVALRLSCVASLSHAPNLKKCCTLP